MDAFDAIREEFKAQFSEEELEEKAALIDRYYHDVEKEAMRRSILDEGKRLDGRKTTEIRPIWCETSYLPGPHGSAIFTPIRSCSLSLRVSILPITSSRLASLVRSSPRPE